jgi:hypothetical protein
LPWRDPGLCGHRRLRPEDSRRTAVGLPPLGSSAASQALYRGGGEGADSVLGGLFAGERGLGAGVHAGGVAASIGEGDDTDVVANDAGDTTRARSPGSPASGPELGAADQAPGPPRPPVHHTTGCRNRHRHRRVPTEPPGQVPAWSWSNSCMTACCGEAAASRQP